jgi:membrane-associated phospholipid phosphatase
LAHSTDALRGSTETTICRGVARKARHQSLVLATWVWLASAVPTRPCLAADAAPTSPPSAVMWQPHWRKSNWIDFTAIAAWFVTGVTLELLPPASESHWSGPILFDRSARDALVSGSSSGRNAAAFASDLGLWGSIGHVALDATLVTMVHHHSSQLGFEMIWMDAEAYSLTVLLNSVTKRLTARARPDTEACRQSPEYHNRCSTEDAHASFYSGHAALSATSAGLICAHHQQLSLYGGAWDGLACVSAIATTSLTGALRVVADRHWASDVVLGHLIGFASGYFVPTIFHYRPPPPTRTARIAGWFPRLEATGGSVVVYGAF